MTRTKTAVKRHAFPVNHTRSARDGRKHRTSDAGHGSSDNHAGTAGVGHGLTELTSEGSSTRAPSSVPDAWPALQARAAQYRALQRSRIRLGNMLGAFERNGVPAEVLENASPMVDVVKGQEARLMKEIAALGARIPRLGPFVEATHGLGPSTFLCMALMGPPPSAFKSVAAYWKRAGYHPHGRPQRGVKLDWAPWRTGAWYAVAEIMLKTKEGTSKAGSRLRASPYRAVYDRTRAPLLEGPTRPCPTCAAAAGRMKEARAEMKARIEARGVEGVEMRERTGAGLDCRNLGGPHWSAGHAHMHALRVMMKALLRDLWRVDRGMAPLYSGQNQAAGDAHTRCVLPGGGA